MFLVFLGMHEFLSILLSQRKIMNISYCNPQASAYQVDQTFALGNALSAIYSGIQRSFWKSERNFVVGENRSN